MLNHGPAQKAYRQNAASTRTARSVEYEVIARITHRLQQSMSRGISGFPDMVAALDENRRLWEAFDADVRDPENPLPKGLKANIAYLAAFTFNRTGKILSGEGDAKTLIEINTTVMRGLRGAEVKS